MNVHFLPGATALRQDRCWSNVPQTRPQTRRGCPRSVTRDHTCWTNLDRHTVGQQVNKNDMS